MSEIVNDALRQGRCRSAYDIQDASLVVEVVHVGHRDGAHRRE